MKKIAATTLVVAGLAVTGWFAACHSFSTVKGSTDVATQTRQIDLSGNRVSGLVYYLPRGRIRIAGDFKSPSGDGEGAAAKSGSEAGAKRLAGAPGSPSGGDSAEEKNFVVTIAADIEADPSQRYYLKPVRNYFYDDDIRLTVNAKHLLSTGNATAEDQTAKIISTTASIAAQAFGVPGPGAPPSMFAKEQMTLAQLLREIEKAIADDTVFINGRIDVSQEQLQQLVDVWRSSPNEQIKRILDRLKTENKTWFTPKDVWDLLRLPQDLQQSVDVSSDWVQKLGRALRAKKWFSPRPFNIVFNPELEKPDDLSDYGFTVTVEREPQPEIKLLKEIWEGKNKDIAHGIAFRAVKPYRVKIQSVRGTWFYIRENRQVLLPDTCPEHTLVLDYSRLAFVKKTTNISFVDGVPQNFEQRTPSSVLGFLAIPKGIIQAIVPLSPGITGHPGGVQGPGTSGTTSAPSPAPPPSPGGS